MKNLTLNIGSPADDHWLRGSQDQVDHCYSQFPLNDSSEDILRCLNDAKASDYIPAILYLVILMVVGATGNLMVGYVYYFRLKKHPYQLFILCLAALDLTNCLVGVPAEIVDLCYPFVYHSTGGCKAVRFIESVVVVSSAVILIQVAVARYHKTYEPLKKLRLHRTRILCGSAFMCGFCLSWPALIIFGKKTIDLPFGLKGQDCSTNDDMEGSVFIVLYYVLLICVFIISVSILSTLYIIIAVKLWRKRRMTIVETQTEGPLEDPDGYTPRSHSLNSSSLDKVPEPGSPNSVTDSVSKKPNLTKTYSIRSSFSVSNHSKAELGRRTSCVRILSVRAARPTLKTGKMTVIMFSITIAFILSFLPYLTIMICRAVDTQWGNFQTATQEVAHKIASKSFFLNSALNPIIYSFFSGRFRRECISTVRDIHKSCSRIRIRASTIGSSGY